jgi:GTP-binding protein
MVANKCDSVDTESEEFKAFAEKCKALGRELVCVSAVTGEGLSELVKLTAEKLSELPPITVYETEITEEDIITSRENATETKVYTDGKKFFVEGEWLYNFMGQINFSDFESLNFFQRVLVKNGVIDMLKLKGIKEGDTVNIYDFEFDFVY